MIRKYFFDPSCGYYAAQPAGEKAENHLADLCPTQKVIGIHCMNLAFFGGIVHCVTQQQPALDTTASAN